MAAWPLVDDASSHASGPHAVSPSALATMKALHEVGPLCETSEDDHPPSQSTHAERASSVHEARVDQRKMHRACTARAASTAAFSRRGPVRSGAIHVFSAFLDVQQGARVGWKGVCMGS